MPNILNVYLKDTKKTQTVYKANNSLNQKKQMGLRVRATPLVCHSDKYYFAS